MKYVFIAILIIIPFVILSCKKDIDDPSIVGKWDYYGSQEWDFSENGNLTISTSKSKKTFKYTVRNGEIRIDARNMELTHNTYVYSYTLTGNEMLLKGDFEVRFGDYFDIGYKLVRK